MKKKGFTLIELLVVIAIIAILAAILFPVFARARENARRASCMSNLKQIALGVFQYTQDYDEMYPPNIGLGKSIDDHGNWPTSAANNGKPSGQFLVSGVGDAGAHYLTWMDSIFPYVKSTQLFVCPSRAWDRDAPSYGYSRILGGSLTGEFGGQGGRTDGGLPLATVSRPSEIVMMADCNQRDWAIQIWMPPFAAAQNGDAGWQKATMNHLEGSNVAYADGHVKWAGIKQPMWKNTSVGLGAPGFARDARAWNPFVD